jgi:hypothetical protein
VSNRRDRGVRCKAVRLGARNGGEGLEGKRNPWEPGKWRSTIYRRRWPRFLDALGALGGILTPEHAMSSAHFPCPPPRRTGSDLIARLAWIAFGLIALAAGPALAGTPLTAFHLNDLNPNSSRLGRTISPRDYGQWISAYYFGNEV